MNPNKNISIRGASEHNLKSIGVDIPRGQLTVVTGVSGSGKSSLVFDTIYKEARRRYLESFSTYARQFLGKLGRPAVEHIDGLSSLEMFSICYLPSTFLFFLNPPSNFMSCEDR